MLGPLSKRLEVNKRWRFYTKEWKKILPPLEVVVRSHEGTERSGTDDIARAGIRSVGLQGHNVFKEIEDVVGPIDTRRPVTRRERKTLLESGELVSDSTSRHPSRWLRRRYQLLLGRIPSLVYSSDPKRPERGSYSVQLSVHALHPDVRPQAHRRAVLDDSHLAWFQQAEALDKKLQKR